MIKRLEILLKEYNLTASRLSERIGVQRSGISHILAGRNKPSFDFLLKLAKEFPEININWLLTGKGEMLVDTIDTIKKEPDLFTPLPPQRKVSNSFISSDEKSENEPNIVSKELSSGDSVYKSKQNAEKVDHIEQIVIFYRDGKFRRFIGE